MKKVYILLCVFLLLVSSVSAMNCDEYVCDPTDSRYLFFIPNATNVDSESVGTSILTIGGGAVVFDDAYSNATDTSIAIPAAYGTGYLNSPWTDIVPEATAINTICMEVLWLDSAMAGTQYCTNRDVGSGKEIFAAGKNCPDDTHLCAGDTQDTGLGYKPDILTSVCFYKNTTGHLISVHNGTEGSTWNMTRTDGAWASAIWDENNFMMICDSADLGYQIMDFRGFNSTAPGDRGVIITPAADPYPADPTFTVETPGDWAYNNTNQTINCSHVGGSEIRYWLNVSEAGGVQEMIYVFNETASPGSDHYSFATNFSDGEYHYSCYVQNITDGTFSRGNISRNLIIDTINPTRTFRSNNGFNLDNTSIINNHIENMILNVSFFDTNLHHILINMTNETEQSVWFKENVSITGTTVNISEMLNLTNLSIGNYTMEFYIADSHTQKDWDIEGKTKVSKLLNYLRYETVEGVDIKIESLTLPLSIDTTKYRDRYDFEFEYLFLKDEYTYRITSDHKIEYLPDSEYKAHFISGNNWIDFEEQLAGLTEDDYEVVRISDYIYEITISSKGNKKFKFKSIGGLNVVEEHYLFQIGAVVDVFAYDGDTGEGLNVTATLGSQVVNGTANKTPARLVNVTQDILEIILNSSGYGSETKEVAITSNYHNLSFNMTPVNSVLIYFYDEVSNTLINEEIMSVYLETTGFSNTYSNINSTEDNPYRIIGLISGFYDLKASSTNYLERQYFNLNISNVTTTDINVYLINSTDGDEKTFSVTDTGINPLEDVSINFTRVLNGTRTTVAEEETDFNGQAKLYLDSNYEYRIIFIKSGYETKTINLEPIDSSYAITLIGTTEEITNRSMGVTYRFSPEDKILNNNTKYNFTFTLNSTISSITNCTLYLKNGSSILNRTTSFSPSSCYLSIEQNTGSLTNITSEAIYEIDSIYNITVYKQYKIIYTYEGEFSLKNFFDDLSDFAMAGFNSFTRMMIALIVIFVIIVLAAKNLGFTNTESLIPIVWALVGLFSYVNWFYLDYAPIPNIPGLRKWIIFVLVSILSLAFFIDKYGR